MSSLVGKKAPAFKAGAVINGGEIVSDFTLESFVGKRHVLFFFYPKDFTFVCPTELHAFQEKLNEFKARNCEVVACSTDTEESHWGWLQMDKKMAVLRVLPIQLLPIPPKPFHLAMAPYVGITMPTNKVKSLQPVP